MNRQKKNLKTVSVHNKNTDLIMKMIKKAKISRVRVPLIYNLPDSAGALAPKEGAVQELVMVSTSLSITCL
jgi:hypothetical protein